MTVTLLHHPGAGEGDWTAKKIIEAFREAGFKPDLVERAEKSWRKSVQATDEFVAVAGGDGTVARVAFLLAGTNVPMAILPTGSGNNIARSLEVMGPLDRIIRGLKDPEREVLRIARIKGPWEEDTFLEGIGLGALAQSVLELQDEKLDGDDKLIRGRDSLISAVQAQDSLFVKILVDDEKVEGAFLIAEILNLPIIGPNLQLAPRSALKDDNLCVALLPVEDREAFVDWLAEGGAGVAPLRHVRGKKVEITGAEQPLRFDDKTRDWDGSRVRLRAAKHHVHILRPGAAR